MAPSRFIYRFGCDLRLDDHAGLAQAATYGEIVPLLAIDAKAQSRLGASPRRAAFFCAAVSALAAELDARGSRLIVRRGTAAAAIRDLARETGATGAAWSAAYHRDGIEADGELQSSLEEAGLRAAIVHDAPAIAPEETAAHSSTGDGYRAFAPFFEVWNELAVGSHEHPLLVRFAEMPQGAASSEALPSALEFGAVQTPANAGAAGARRRLAAFLSGAATNYAQASGVPAVNGTSGLGADLSFGTISARAVVASVRGRLADPLLLAEERFSLRRFLRSLARRDFFLQLSWFHPQTDRLPLQEKMRGFSFATPNEGYDAWCEGRTGFPLVDAGMRQLLATGWMHPYVRAVAASFLCFDLGVDWSAGRDYWNRLLVEDDPALATGNWQWTAAVGADMAQYPRIYNPQRQRVRCDPDGAYVRQWIPELRDVPVEQWRERRAESAQLKLNLSAPNGYPEPMLDHARAAREFLRRYRAFASA